MSNNRITPFVKRMRTNGGTIYTFSSAVEDIGLNINERNNVVKISHFALLDIPSINEPTDIEENRFNVNAIAGAWEYAQDSASIKDGRVLIAESFQNYALNLESNLLNSDDYNPTLTRTVTERVFWKWLKETGAIRFDKDLSVGSTQYWGEELDADGSLGYNRVVKYVGPVSAGNVRTDTFGTYNETYVLVPTSHGQTDAYFQIIEDENYHHGMEIGDLGENILGRESYTLPQPDGLSYKAYYDFVDSSTQVGNVPYFMYYDNSVGSYSPGWWYTAEGVEPSSTDNAYLTDSSIYLSTGIYDTTLKYDDGGGSTIEFKRSKVDCISLVSSLDQLKGIYGDPALTYDKMAMEYAINDVFNFNAVLIYYTVYNSTMDEVLGRNLLGVLFIDAPSGNSADIGFAGITIPSLEKIQSGPGGFGTSYSLRLNIKTDNMVDDTTATIVDQSTSDQLNAENWTEAFANLNTAVNLLTQNTSVIQYLTEQYQEVQNTQTQILNDIQQIEYQVNDIGRDIQGTANTLALFADGDDPLVDSSVYMRFGNVGIKNKNPQYPFHISGTTKADEIIIENAIRDTSGNVILGYGSPLQIGSSTNYREIDMYIGDNNPAVTIDTSSHMDFDGDVSLLGSLGVSGESIFAGSVTFDGSLNSSGFNFNANYLTESSIGIGFSWIGGYLNVDVSSSGGSSLSQLSDVSIGGSIPDGSSLVYDVAGGYWTYGAGGGGVDWISGFGSAGEIVTSAGDGNIQTGGLNSASTSNIVYYDISTGVVTYSPIVAVTQVNNGNGMDFTNITSSGTVTLGTPTTNLSGNTTNSVTSNSHTHALELFTSSVGGICPPSGGGTTNFLRADGNWAAPGGGGTGTVTSVGAGNGLDFTTITTTGNVTLGTPGTLTSATSNGVTSTSHTHAITTGISNTNIVRIDAADVASGRFPQFTTNGLDGLTSTEFRTAIGAGTVTSVGGTGTVNGLALSGTVTSSGNLTLGGSLSVNNSDWSGTNLSVSNGGTGLSTVGTNYMLTGNGTGSLTAESNLTFSGSLLSVTGSILATAEITSYSSDRRLKNNIRNIENPLEKLNQLNGVTFNWIDDILEKGFHPLYKEEVGLIAQELQAIFPDAVAPAPFDLDNKGNSRSGENYLTTKSEKVIPLLVESVKQLSGTISEQSEKIIKLEKIIEDIKNNLKNGNWK